MSYSSFTSALNVPDFAACRHLGMRPVALVQGFCVMSWRFSRIELGTWGYLGSGLYTRAYDRDLHGERTYYNGRPISEYLCPHTAPERFLGDHRWFGCNMECTEMEAAWGRGYNGAYQRLMKEAREFGAHGVIGITDATKTLPDPARRQFHLYGTAVVFENSRPPKEIWSTYLAGPRLAKLFEAGLLPISIVAANASVSVHPMCVTEVLENAALRSYWDTRIDPASEITQLSDAHTSARRLARDHVKSRLGNDELHGAELTVHEYHDLPLEVISAELRGTRVRRFRDVEPLPSPVPTVRLVG